jgi:hypothetical protein
VKVIDRGGGANAERRSCERVEDASKSERVRGDGVLFTSALHTSLRIESP